MMAFISLCIGLIALLSFKQPTLANGSVGSVATSNSTNKVVIDVYFETLCPDSKDFIVDQVYPTYLSIGEIMQVNLVPFGKAFYYKQNDGTYTFSCQHGQNECLGNTIESCVLHLIPDVSKQMSFVYCMSQKSKPWKETQTCARGSNMSDDDYNRIKQCSETVQGQKFLVEEGDKTKSLQPPLHYVPWVVINKTFNETQRNLAYQNLKKLVCNLFKGPQIVECNNAK